MYPWASPLFETNRARQYNRRAKVDWELAFNGRAG